VAPLRWLVPVLVLALLGPAAGPGRAGERKAEEIGLVKDLDRIDRQLSELKHRRRVLGAEEQAAAREVEAGRRRLAGLERARTRLKERLTPRLRALYACGQANPGWLVLNAPQWSEALFGWLGLRRVVRFDLELIKDYNKLRQELEEARLQRRARLSEIKGLRARLDRAEAELADQRRRRAELLVKLRQEPETYERALADLDRAAAGLQEEIAALAAAAPAGPAVGGMAESKGRLPWPLPGRLGRMTGQSRPGVLILAVEGSPVKAIGAGRVIFANWVKGYGLVVIIDHGARYYTLSGHLEEMAVRVGQEVEAGQVLGRAGRAGLAAPGVYFEIRYQHKALDPSQWLAGSSG